MAEALPLLGCRPRVVGMGQQRYDLGDCEAVISAGFAGACQSWLEPGDVVLAGSYEPVLKAALRAADGEIRTVDHIASPAEKAHLGRTGIAAVDMETRWLREAAESRPVPFLGIRVVIDGLGDRAAGLAAAAHYPLAALRLRRAVCRALELWPGKAGR